jgi:hypothetical protein
MRSQPLGRVFNKIIAGQNRAIAQEFGIPSSSVFKLLREL